MCTPKSTDSAKVFMSGKSRAIRLPKRFRLYDGCDSVLVSQMGRHLMLSPHYDDWDNSARTAGDFVETVLNRNASELLSEKRECFD